MKKKILSLLLATTFLLAACGTKNNANVNEGAKSDGDTTTVQEPLELTMHMHFRNAYVYSEDWPVFKEAAKATNITLKGVAPSSATDTKEVFNLLMVSGDLPDIVEGNDLRDNFIKYGLEGAFVPLEDLIAEHAPNLQAFLDEHPYVKTFCSGPDGHMYFVPYIPDGGVSKGYYIRQDWLDKLGLQQPTNVDELHDVLTAFANNDPNGNGVKDEIPYFTRHVGENFKDNEATRLAHFWGAKTDFYVDENGKVQHGLVSKEFKEGISNVAKWYDEGLIDPEIYTRGGKARDIALGNNIGGFTHDWFGSTAAYNDNLASEIEGFSFQPIAPPADINGKSWEEFNRDLVKPDGWAITSSNEHQVETIKYFDFWFSEEGRRLMNFGIEGVQYDMVDGKPIFKDEIINGESSVQNQLWEIGAQVPIGFYQDFSYELQTYNEVAQKGVNMYTDGDYLIEPFPYISFNEEEQKKFDEIYTNITTYMMEAHQKWVLGAESVDEGWDKYIKTLDDLGFQDLLQIYQAAYDRL
ncbi:extracellular solute-binding protein [Clostridium grantii]|uniref:Carbohydrate ABC transporter substrate-binding protein, CUT1 family (TC 3.A.1.1.-) n=1 Tax=Clostridium grantii DSM 8605 TaxID=1121316 RepID=A0A1M5WMB1_9CLOT|nr:extracellular solute-binding protein [Clostridium grantii]SHH88552.1 carbohydrate ABC transporter substrate-binding protein, CUT1 family (TC 3.A.1.1.-) [Clostridium grantii DSM 8605]